MPSKSKKKRYHCQLNTLIKNSPSKRETRSSKKAKSERRHKGRKNMHILRKATQVVKGARAAARILRDIREGKKPKSQNMTALKNAANHCMRHNGVYAMKHTCMTPSNYRRVKRNQGSRYGISGIYFDKVMKRSAKASKRYQGN